MDGDSTIVTTRNAENSIVNLSRFPLVIATLPEVVDDAALDALFEGVKSAAAKNAPYVLLTDASRVQKITVGDVMARILESMRVVTAVESQAAATAVVAPTLAFRTLIRVGRLASPATIPRKTFATVHAALEWSTDIVDAMEPTARPA